MANTDILVVSAHAADFCTRAGGAIARYAREGYRVRILAMTLGVRGESGGYWLRHPSGTERECGDIRREEARAAAAVLGAAIEFWECADYPLVFDEERQRRLTRTVLDIRPAIVLTHWLEDPTNADHENTARATVNALASAAQIGAFPNTPAHPFPDLFLFESTVPYAEFNRFSPDVYVDIDDVHESKMAAIGCFACQPQLGGYYDHFARHRGFQASSWSKRTIVRAEAFKRYFPHVGRVLPLMERPEKE